MRAVVVAFAALSAFVAGMPDQSSAADMPVKAVRASPLSPVSYAWSGFYVGVSGGYGWSDGRTDIGINDPTGVTQANVAAGTFPVAFAFDRSGYVAGAQIGFNYQAGSVVWGVEADLSATGIKGSQSVITPPCGFCGGPNLSSVNQDMDWFGTVRGRIGYAANNWLFYGTGGLAYGHVNQSYLNTNAPFGGPLTIAASVSDVLVGWTAGGGIEYGFGPWSAKVEYLYYDLGSISVTAPNPLAPPGLGVALIPNFKVDGSIVRGGINYRFASGL